MLFFNRKRHSCKDSLGYSRNDIAYEKSICTGETLMGFKNSRTGRLERAVVVRNRSDEKNFYKEYGL